VLGKLSGGGVSERPKEHASKACDGKHRPRVQIPPPPPYLRAISISLFENGAAAPARDTRALLIHTTLEAPCIREHSN
jgi:hypothetical protein